MYELSLLAAKRVEREDRHMADGLEVSPRRVRRWHPISEKLKIVKLSLQPGVSVAEVARSRCEREPVRSRGGGLRAWRTERAERSAVTGDGIEPGRREARTSTGCSVCRRFDPYRASRPSVDQRREQS